MTTADGSCTPFNRPINPFVSTEWNGVIKDRRSRNLCVPGTITTRVLFYANKYRRRSIGKCLPVACTKHRHCSTSVRTSYNTAIVVRFKLCSENRTLNKPKVFFFFKREQEEKTEKISRLGQVDDVISND